MKNPFVGLRPFQSAENELFFGRDRDIAVLQNLILAVPVLVVYAPSGTGKSSLLNAGLLPKVERDETLVPIAVADPFDNVVEIARARLASSDPGADLPESARLADILERHLETTDRRVILVLDQFEERLKDRAALDSLYSEVARLANTRSEAATVIISIREDYLAGLEKLMRRVTGLLDASYRVPNLSREALTEAVHGPLQVQAVDDRVTIDDGLIDEVLDDLERETYHHPESLEGHGRIEAGYFQVVWSHLWAEDALRGHRLTRSTYQDQGGATGILESFVADTLSQLPPFEAEALCAVIRYLVLPTGAKVPLTVDDLLGLLRPDDFTPRGQQLVLERRRYGAVGPGRAPETQGAVRDLLEAVLYHLARTDTPLFRRVVRGDREEFELVHDLLGLILLTWRQEFGKQEEVAEHRILRDIFGVNDTEEVEDVRVSRKAVHDRLGSATAMLGTYRDNLGSLKTAEGAENNWVPLRSDLAQLASIPKRDARWMAMPLDFSERLQAVETTLPEVARNHHSREVRHRLQVQLLQFRRVHDYIRTSMFNGRVRGRSSVLHGATLWALGLVLAISGLIAARWAIERIWQVPDVEYVPLTLGIISFCASILYAGMLSIAWKPGAGLGKGWPAIAKLLWPVPYPGNWFSMGPSTLLPNLATILVWWPLHYALLEALCFAGAAIFQAIGSSPTAGFHFSALILTIPAGFAYGFPAAMSLERGRAPV